MCQKYLQECSDADLCQCVTTRSVNCKPILCPTFLIDCQSGRSLFVPAAHPVPSTSNSISMWHLESSARPPMYTYLIFCVQTNNSNSQTAGSKAREPVSSASAQQRSVTATPATEITTHVAPVPSSQPHPRRWHQAKRLPCIPVAASLQNSTWTVFKRFLNGLTMCVCGHRD
ncbi:steroid receptor-associated and regulated protein [Microcaecilia unicolor]|uniref:Steroid receptor-associated and regulated protein n=1 Tax=Microcaecilia unicolor TaxID=1415580 RepID=A0A6P7ZVW4_9AMPH|nr:steroid receptor-associated and regulated protein [Microcaecilia unicolor]